VIIPTVGYLIDRLGFLNAFSILGITIISLTLACSVFLWETKARASVT